MKTTSKMALRLAAVLALGTGFALAQSNINNLKATIPFDFKVGNATLPAGDYTVETRPGSAVVAFVDAANKTHATALGVNVAPHPGQPNRSKLVFRVEGGNHYLASTWNATSGTGRELPKTAAEREAEMAGVPSTVTVYIAQK